MATGESFYFDSRFHLLDSNKQATVSHFNPSLNWRYWPIKSTADDPTSTTIGYLARQARNLQPTPQLQQYQAAQTQALWWVLATAAILASLAALWLGRHLLLPIRQLHNGSVQLSQGNYQIAIPTTGSAEFSELAHSFNAAIAAVADNKTREQQWLADVAHELRTPLAALRSELEAIEDGVREANENAIQSLQDEVRHLSSMVQDLHMLSASEAGQLPLALEALDLSLFAREVTEKHRTALETKGLRLRFDFSQAVIATADQRRLRQVLENLLQNCLSHAVAGPLLISTHKRLSAVELRLTDSGPGVPEHALPRLFDHLYRVDPAKSRSSGGRGLGLAICRSVIAAHDGQISASNSAMGGLEIRIQLPAGEINT